MEEKNIQVSNLLVNPSFIAYVQKSDPKAEAYWQNLIEEKPENREIYDSAATMIKNLMVEISDEEVEEAVSDFKHSILVRQNFIIPLEHPLNRMNRLKWYRYAAIFLVFVTSAFVLGFFIKDQLNQRNLVNNPNTTKWIAKQTTRGQKSTIILRDGTHIKLNSESTIFISEDFSGKFREVRLVGEAFFNVAHDPEHPFIVYCNNTTTKALGTSFNINAYPENKNTNIALVEGKVIVKYAYDGDSVYLKPKELLQVSKTSTEFIKEEFDPHEVTAWKDGIIRFRKAKFDEIKNVLERWYDVGFVVYTNPTVKAFSGEFDNKNLDEVMKGISFSLDFTYKLDDKDKKVYIN